MRLRLITPQDFEKASSVMQKALQNNITCNEFSCDFLAACAASLAFDAGYVRQVRENPALNQNYAKLVQLQTYAARNWGSDKSNSVMAVGILRAAAALGSAQNLADLSSVLLLPKLGFFKERAMRKITSSGLSEQEFATTFHRFANELDPAAEWFVSGRNVALKGRGEVAKYVKAMQQGVKDIPVTDGKVALNIAADLGEEGVSYRVITRPSQLAKLNLQIKPVQGKGEFVSAPYASVGAETANKDAVSALTAKRTEEARMAAKHAEEARRATKRAEQARIAANHTEEGRAAVERLEDAHYAARDAEEVRIATERDLLEIERKVAATPAKDG